MSFQFDETKRYHISLEPIKKLRKVDPGDPNEVKKDGSCKPVNSFWYSLGSEWYTEMLADADLSNSYVYEVQLDPKLKLLKFDTFKKVVAFSEKLRKLTSPQEDYWKIKSKLWTNLAKKYDGIEYIPFLEREFVEKYLNKEKSWKKTEDHFSKYNACYFLWYVTLLIPSGAIWNPRKTKLIQIKNFNQKELIITTKRAIQYLHLDDIDDKLKKNRDKLVKNYQNEIGPIDNIKTEGIQTKQQLAKSRILFIKNLANRNGDLIGTAKIVFLGLRPARVNFRKRKLKATKKGFAELINVFIFKKFRGKGLCQRLVLTMVNRYKEEFPDTKILLIVAKENTPAIKCYRKVGFKNFNGAPWLIKRFCEEYPELSKKYTFQVMSI